MSPTPHGGILCDLHSRDSSIRSELLAESLNSPHIILSERSLCDLELIMNGGFSPLKGFMTQEDYYSVLNSLRLSNGTLWSMPITLDINDEEIHHLSIKLGSRIVLKDPRDNNSLAILTISSLWKPNKIEEAEKVLGTTDLLHPSVEYLFNQTNPNYIGGEIQSINLPIHYDYTSLRFTPFQLRQKFQDSSWKKIIAFQTRNPMHKAHVNLTLKASSETNGNLLIHPVVGLTKPGDIDYQTRVKVYKAVIDTYPDGLATLALLPLAMRMAGPREAVWHAIIRRNYGATHFIVGRDHAGPGKSSQGSDFYSPYEAQSLVQKYQTELGIEIIPFASMIYLPKTNEYKPINEIEKGIEIKDISGTQLRKLLQNGDEIPSWFSFESVIEILKEAYPPRNKQGFVVLLTGLDRPARTNLSKALETTLQEKSTRSVTLLSNLPTSYQTRKFDPEATKTHSFICAELCKSGSAVISCSNVTSKEENRNIALKYVKKEGGRGGNGMGVLVYVSSGFENGDGVNGNSKINGNNKINGDVKINVNAKINGFAGNDDDDFEVPSNPDLIINLSVQTIPESVQQIIALLELNRLL